MNDFFGGLRQLIAADALEPALAKLVNAVQGARDELGSPAVNTALLLSAQCNRYRLDRTRNVLSPDELARSLNGLTSRALDFVDVVASRWGRLPLPAVGPAPGPTGDAPDDPMQPDPREAAVAGNPLRNLAWLEAGLRVARAVCKKRTPFNVGTGFLLSDGRIVTNNHVLPTPDIARNSYAIFNFAEDLEGRPTIPVTFALSPDKLFTTNPDVDRDCTVVAVNAPVAKLDQWGFLNLHRAAELPQTSGVSIIQHPDGGYKQIALAGNIITRREPDTIYYGTTTMPGSSGAPVFDDNWTVIALHQGGGVWSKAQQRFLNNKGLRFSSLVSDTLLTGCL